MNQLKHQSKEELEDTLISLLITNFKLRIQKATQQLSNPEKLKTSRKNIARLKTKLNIR